MYLLLAMAKAFNTPLNKSFDFFISQLLHL